MSLVAFIIAETAPAVQSSNTLVVLLAALFAGGLAGAIGTYFTDRRKQRYEEKKDSDDARQKEFTRREERDSIIAESSRQAVAFLRDELDLARQTLQETRLELKRLKEEVEDLRRRLEGSEGTNKDLRARLEEAIKEIERRRSVEDALAKRVRALEATDSKRPATPKPKPQPPRST